MSQVLLNAPAALIALVESLARPRHQDSLVSGRIGQSAAKDPSKPTYGDPSICPDRNP